MNESSLGASIKFLLDMKGEILTSVGQTALMLTISVVVSVILGGLLGILLYVTGKDKFWENSLVHKTLGQVVNFMRAFPFVILVIAMTGVTRFFLGTSIGTFPAAFVLSVAGTFYFARLMEQNLREVPKGIIEASQAMGATPAKIVFGVLITEARSGIALSITILTIMLLSESAATGMVGGGGLGDLAIRYGYYRFNVEVIVLVVLILSLAVIAIQAFGNYVAMKLDKR